MKRLIARNYRLLGAILFIKGLSDWISGGQFWYGIGFHVFPSLASCYGTWYGRLITAIVGAFLVFFPWNRLRNKSYDLTTLKGATLKLRDDMQSFLDSVPKPTTAVKGAGGDPTIHNVDRLNTPLSLYMAALEHGYYLKFYVRVCRLRHEYGKFGIQERDLTEAIAKKQFDNPGTYLIMIGALNRFPTICDKANPNLSESETFPFLVPRLL